MGLPGILDLYPIPDDEDDSSLPYFTTGDTSASRTVVFIGGLYCGLLEPDFIPSLAGALQEAKWRLVLMSWSSMGDGFGTGSLNRDVAEMSELIKHIRANDGVKDVVIMGHSTGSQDVIHYLTGPRASSRQKVQGGIMQGPASDREYFNSPGFEDHKLWKKTLVEAEKLLKQGKPDEWLSDEFSKSAECVMTAYRLHSLMGIGGDDDYFSSDLPDNDDTPSPHIHPLNTSFGKLPTPALVLWSEKDQYGFLKDQRPLLKRWEAAANGKLTAKVVEGAAHEVKERKHQEQLCDFTVSWLKEHFS